MKVTREIINNLIPYFFLYNKKLKDKGASITRTYTKNFNKDNNDVLTYNSGVMSDGSKQYININVLNNTYSSYGINFSYDEKFYRIVTNFSLSNNIDVLKKRKIVPILSLSENELPHVHVYINGAKIPDKDVLVYISTSYLDIIISEDFINPTNNEFFIEKVEDTKNEYISNYFTYISNNYIIPLTSEEFSDININTDNILVYIDGFLKSNVIQNVIKNSNNTITIFIKENIITQLNNCIEFIFKKSIYNRKTYSVLNTKKIPFYMTEDIDPLYGPLSEISSQFYVNGKRIPNTSVDQDGRIHYVYNSNEIIPTATIDMIYSGEDVRNDIKYPIYFQDYYIYKFLGNKYAALKAINNTEYSTNTVLDISNLDYDSIFRVNELTYTKENNEKILGYSDLFYNKFNINGLSESDFNMKIAEDVIKDHPYTIKPFFENYRKECRQFNLNYSGNDSAHVLGMLNPELGQSVILTAFCNGNLVYDKFEVITNININSFNSIEIKPEYLKQGNNYIEIIWYKLLDNGNHIQLIKVNPDDFVRNEGKYVFQTTFDNIVDENDIVILKHVNNNSNYLYQDGRNGYRPIDGYDITITNGTDVTISKHTMPIEPIIVYCKRFIYYYNTTMPEYIENNVDDMFIPIYDKDLPVFPAGSLLVVAENKILYNEVDYIFRDYSSLEFMTYSGITIKKKLAFGTPINIYFIPYNNETVLYKDYIRTDNKYGFLYLSELRVPYSSKYVDVYVNYKKIHEDDIEIWSDKLIRLTKETVPMYNVYVNMNFSIDITTNKINTFIRNCYLELNFERLVSEWFKSYDYMDSTTLSSYNAVNVFESFMKLKFENKITDSNTIETILDNVKNIVDTDKSADIDNTDLTVQAYLDLIKNNKILPCINPLAKFDDDTRMYLKLFDKNIDDDSLRIKIEPHKTILHAAVILNKYDYTLKNNERSYFIAKTMSELSNKIHGTIEQTDVYKNSDAANKLLLHDIVPIAAHDSKTSEEDAETIIIGRGIGYNV